MIVPIVEGQSEVRAIGVLIRRVLHEAAHFDVEVARPFRVKRQKVVRDGELERAITQAERSRSGASALLIMLDADRDCPATVGQELRARGEAHTALRVRVVLPKVESEAWILAGIDSVRGVRGIRADAQAPADPEAVRDAKGALTQLMEGTRGYVPTDDQAAFFDRLDLELVAARSPSFAKFRRDVASIASRPDTPVERFPTDGGP